jgi:hypothetical protein
MGAEPCPFCGADEPEYVTEVCSCYHQAHHYYECRKCRSRGPYLALGYADDLQMQALVQWNLRAERPTTGGGDGE